MGLIPAETLENIRARLNIAELVAEYVPGLQRAGRNMKGRCPFHSERTPSFIVSAERQTFHCFGCGEGGDAFTFVMKIENLSFMEAAEKLADRAGVKLETREDLGPEAMERLKLKALLDFAATWYHEALKNSPDADAARRYLASRKVSAKSVDTFRLGFAARGLASAAQKKGFTAEQLLKAGLAAKREDGNLRDYFFNRVLFPIFDAKGSVVAFGGRIMGEGEPKYLNSPETPLFSKRTTLYGLSHAAAAIRKDKRALLMEGYMDVIAAHQYGIANACAPLGTALTPEHGVLLGRFCKDILVIFDADGAGINAAIRGADLLLEKEFSVKVVTVTDGKDPDELLHDKGVPAFEECLKRAVDLVAFQTEVLVRRAERPLTAETKAAIAKEVLLTIEKSPNDVLRSEWIQQLALRLEVPMEALLSQSAKLSHLSSKSRRVVNPIARPAPTAALNGQDEELLLHLFKKPEISGLATQDDFASAEAREIWRALKDMQSWTADWTVRLNGLLPQVSQQTLARLLLKLDNMPKEDAETRVKAILAKRRGQKRLLELQTMLREGKLQEESLKEEFNRLLVQLKGSPARA